MEIPGDPLELRTAPDAKLAGLSPFAHSGIRSSGGRQQMVPLS